MESAAACGAGWRAGWALTEAPGKMGSQVEERDHNLLRWPSAVLLAHQTSNEAVRQVARNPQTSLLLEDRAMVVELPALQVGHAFLVGPFLKQAANALGLVRGGIPRHTFPFQKRNDAEKTQPLPPIFGFRGRASPSPPVPCAPSRLG